MMSSQGRASTKQDRPSSDARAGAPCCLQNNGACIQIDADFNISLSGEANLPSNWSEYLRSIQRVLQEKARAQQIGRTPDLTPLDAALSYLPAVIHDADPKKQSKIKVAKRNGVNQKRQLKGQQSKLVPLGFSNGVKRSFRIIGGDDVDDDSSSQGSTSDVEPDYSEEVSLGASHRFEEWYTAVFRYIQQQVCRVIAQDWVKAIHPGKQSEFPYSSNNSKTDFTPAPKWWPEDVQHKEPAHIKTPQRMKLLIQIIHNLRNLDANKMRTELEPTEHGFPALNDMRKATDENPKIREDGKGRALPWLKRIYAVAQARIEWEDSGRPEGTVQLHWPKKGSRKSKRQKSEEAYEDVAAQLTTQNHRQLMQAGDGQGEAVEQNDDESDSSSEGGRTFRIDSEHSEAASSPTPESVSNGRDGTEFLHRRHGSPKPLFPPSVPVDLESPQDSLPALVGQEPKMTLVEEWIPAPNAPDAGLLPMRHPMSQSVDAQALQTSIMPTAEHYGQRRESDATIWGSQNMHSQDTKPQKAHQPPRSHHYQLPAQTVMHERGMQMEIAHGPSPDMIGFHPQDQKVMQAQYPTNNMETKPYGGQVLMEHTPMPTAQGSALWHHSVPQWSPNGQGVYMSPVSSQHGSHDQQFAPSHPSGPVFTKPRRSPSTDVSHGLQNFSIRETMPQAQSMSFPMHPEHPGQNPNMMYHFGHRA